MNETQSLPVSFDATPDFNSGTIQGTLDESFIGSLSTGIDRDEKMIENLLGRREFARAKILLDKKRDLDPTGADTNYLMGVYYYFQNQFSPAIARFEECLETDPSHTDAAICLSVIFNDVGRYEDAKRIFELANRSIDKKKSSDPFSVDKKFAIKHLELADLYFRYRRYDEAIEQYSIAAKLDSHTPEVRIRLSKALAKNGHLPRALQELQTLKSDHPNLLVIRIQIGLLYYSQGDILEAEEEWESVLKTDPNHSEAKKYLEMAKYARTQPSKRAGPRDC